MDNRTKFFYFVQKFQIYGGVSAPEFTSSKILYSIK
jgi:hypothetical protein